MALLKNNVKNVHGEGWVRGMLKRGEDHSQKVKAGLKKMSPEEKKLWSERQSKSQSECMWFNNGKINMRSKTHPGEGWVRGMLTTKKEEI